MTIDFDADLNELLSADDFGMVVRRDDNSAFHGILYREFVEQVVDGETGVGSIGPAVRAKTSDAAGLREGDRLRFYSTDADGNETLTATFRVKTRNEQDGTGESIVELRRA